MSHYSIHHAALRIDYLVAAYSHLADGAPYDPEGIPAEIMHDVWHVAGGAGIDPLSLRTGGRMRYVADFQSIEDELQRRDPRLAEKVGTTITGIDWECVSGVIESCGSAGGSLQMAVPPPGTAPHERRARGLWIVDEWAQQAQVPPQLGLQARLIRFVADVIQWASWMDIDHEAAFCAGEDRYMNGLLGGRGDIQQQLRRADDAAWQALAARHPLTSDQWQRLADVYRCRIQGDLGGPVSDLAEALFS